MPYLERVTADQDQPLSVDTKTVQKLRGERLHHLAGIDQVTAQKARYPLITHIQALGCPWQGRRKVHQVGAAHIQHRGDQQRQPFTLLLVLIRQPHLQIHGNRRGNRLDPTRHAPNLPRKTGGFSESHDDSLGQAKI